MNFSDKSKVSTVNRGMGASLTPQRAPLAAFLIAACFFLLFLALRTNNFTSMDGALRCLGVFFKGDRFHDNNHMLYPFWISMWARVNDLLGIHASDAFQFIRISQAMNAFAAASSVGFLYLLIEPLAGLRAAVLGSLAFGFSGALTVQATTSDEAPAGLFFALLALVILASGVRNSNPIAVFLAGFCMTLGLASYEAMGTVVGPAILLCCFWPVSPSGQSQPIVRRLVIAAAGGAVGVFIVYGWAYASQGVPLTSMPFRFLSLGGAPQVYAGADLIITKVLNAPFGLIEWLFAAVPPDYGGIRSLLHHSLRFIWVPVVFVAFSLIAVIFVLAVQGWRIMARPVTPLRLALALGAGLFVGFPLWYWSPLNPKLWLFPLACIVFVLSAGSARGLLAPRAHKLLTACLLVWVLAEIARNVPVMVRDHINATPHLEDAAEVAGMIGPDDWVVLDFDDVSTLWQSIWGYNAKSLLLPASTLTSASQWLDRAKASCRERRGRILFIGVLQQSRATWDAFLGSRVGIPFEFLDDYRKRATLLKRLNKSGSPVEVWQFTPASS